MVMVQTRFRVLVNHFQVLIINRFNQSSLHQERNHTHLVNNHTLLQVYLIIIILLIQLSDLILSLIIIRVNLLITNVNSIHQIIIEHISLVTISIIVFVINSLYF